MTFRLHAWKNIARQKARLALAVFGVGLGTFTMVALGAFARGYERNFLAVSGLGAGELVVVRVTKKTPMPSAYDSSRVQTIRDHPEVEAAMAASWDLLEVEGVGRIMVMGWEFPGFLWDSLTWIEGGLAQGEGIYLGEMAADRAGVVAGGILNVAGRDYRVLGIFRCASLIENGAIVMRLETFQPLLSSGDKIRTLHVRLRPDITKPRTEEFREGVRKSVRGFRAVPASELAGENPVIPLVRGTAATIGFLAFLIAALGVANLGLSIMHERRGEMAVLSALGWSRIRMTGLVLLEFGILGGLGASLGAAIGAGAVMVLERVPQVAGNLSPILSPALVFGAIGCGVLCAVLGALFPVLHTTLRPAACTLREL